MIEFQRLEKRFPKLLSESPPDAIKYGAIEIQHQSWKLILAIVERMDEISDGCDCGKFPTICDPELHTVMIDGVSYELRWWGEDDYPCLKYQNCDCLGELWFEHQHMLSEARLIQSLLGSIAYSSRIACSDHEWTTKLREQFQKVEESQDKLIDIAFRLELLSVVL